jgi:hypothetical protein
VRARARRLQFFEKDPIDWKEHPNGELYRKLFALRSRRIRGKYTEYFTGEAAELDGSSRVGLRPWGYKVFVK